MWQGVSGRYRKGVSSIFSPDPAYQKLASEMDPTHVRMGAKVVFDLFDHQIHDKGRLISVFNRHNETVATDSRPPFPGGQHAPGSIHRHRPRQFSLCCSWASASEIASPAWRAPGSPSTGRR